MRAICVSADPSVIEQVEACAAAAGVVVSVTDRLDEVAKSWRTADLVLVAADLAAAVVECGLPSRAGVHLVGREADALVSASVPLSASVVVLPGQSSALSALLSSAGGDQAGRGQVVRLVGGSGGVGVSTLAGGLALAGARAELSVAAVELALSGGGLDLLLGAEGVPGWRWPDLRAASGHVGDLRGRVPRVCGVDLVSAGRDLTRVGAGASRAVVESLTRTHQLVVIDAGRGEDATAASSVNSQTWLVVAADVRSVMAARGLIELAGLVDPALVVRQGRGRSLPAEEVAQALGLPVVGRVRDDPRVPAESEAGDPSGRARRSVLAKDCAALLQTLTPVPTAAEVTTAAPPNTRPTAAATPAAARLVRAADRPAGDLPAEPGLRVLPRRSA